MNFSRLIKAMALVGLVGFGSHVVAAEIGADDFENYTNGVFNAQEGANWTALENDLSEIVTKYVTELGELPACATTKYEESGKTYSDGYVPAGDLTKLLKLNTEGNDLKYAAASTDLYDVYVDTLLQVVASDTPPTLSTIDATNIQTAVYLNTTDECLYGWGTDTNATPTATNAWIKLDGVSVTNTQWICLQISLDYVTGYFDTQAYATVRVNGTVAGSYVVANAALGRKAIAEGSFRGTGMVDNFSVNQTENGLSLATIIKQCVDADGNIIDPALGDTGTKYEIDQDSVSDAFWVDLANGSPAYPQYELDRVELVGPGFTNVLSGTEVAGEYGVEFDVNSTPPPAAFEDDGTYYLRGVYTIKQFTVTVVYDGEGAPANPSPEVLNYGEDFDFDLNDIVDTNGVAIVVNPASGYGANGEIFYGDTELPEGSTVLTLADVTANLTVTISGDFGGAAEPVVALVPTEGNPFEWTTIATGSPVTFSFTSGGTVNGAVPVDMDVLVSETVNGAAFVITGSVTAAEETAGVVTGTVTAVTDVSAYDTLFFRGFRYE